MNSSKFVIEIQQNYKDFVEYFSYKCNDIYNVGI